MHKTIVFITSLQPSNHQNFIPNPNRHIEVHTIKKNSKTCTFSPNTQDFLRNQKKKFERENKKSKRNQRPLKSPRLRCLTIEPRHLLKRP